MTNSTSSADSIDWAQLPTSVRGCDSAELRRLIRKRQNSLSAKRCRQRRKLEKKREVDTASTHAAQMRALEAVVAQLSSRLSHMQAVVSTLLANSPPPPPSSSTVPDLPPASPVSPPSPSPSSHHQPVLPGSPVTPVRVPGPDEYSFFADTVDELALS